MQLCFPEDQCSGPVIVREVLGGQPWLPFLHKLMYVPDLAHVMRNTVQLANAWQLLLALSYMLLVPVLAAGRQPHLLSSCHPRPPAGYHPRRRFEDLSGGCQDAWPVPALADPSVSDWKRWYLQPAVQASATSQPAIHHAYQGCEQSLTRPTRRNLRPLRCVCQQVAEGVLWKCGVR